MLADPHPPKPPVLPATVNAQGVDTTRRIDSTALLGSRGEVHILHNEQIYRLRITAQGKLILTK